MSNDLIIRVENLGKRYRLQHHGERLPYLCLREVLTQRTKNLVCRLWCAATGSRRGANHRRQTETEEFWALRHVSFAVRQGEVLGIIGRNGAGKSTLLKILSRITEPTEGRVELCGRLASLLEVGTGFHPELTGRENIFLNGAILGMSKAEIRRKFDEIVAFAEIEKFLDTPVKRYSSGMYVRLAFAVAAHLEPEILVIDEVLAVGDAEFQRRCLGKMNEVARVGRTVLVVSHNFGLIRTLCTAAVALDAGRLVSMGQVEQVIASLATAARQSELPNSRFLGTLRNHISFERVLVNGLDPLQDEAIISPHQPLEIQVEYVVKEAFPGRVTLALFAEGARVMSAFDHPAHQQFTPGKWRSRFEWPARLLRPNFYSVALGAYSSSKFGPFVWGSDLATFQVGAEWSECYEERALGLLNFPAAAVRCRIH